MKTKVHTQYKLNSGKHVPGATTITGQLGKPALIHWAWGLGKRGIDYKKYRDDKADIGTLAHAMAIGYLTGEKADTSDYTAKQIDQAENCLISFYEWMKGKDIEPIHPEEPIVSELYKYGGTPDLPCRLNGAFTLIDLKTGKAIYDEMVLQLAAYEQLISEVYQIEMKDAMILRIGRDEQESFEVKRYSALQRNIAFGIFKNLLNVYYGMKELKGVA